MIHSYFSTLFKRRHFVSFCALPLLALASCTRPATVSESTPAAPTNPPALSSIKEEDLRRDLFILASDSLRGRRAGESEELRAAAWVAERAREAGLEPAGDDGTYFQFFPLRRVQVSSNSSFQINGHNIPLWKDAWVTSPVEANLDGPAVWLTTYADTAKQSLKGKIVAMPLQAPNPLPAPGMSLWGYRYTLSAVRQASTILRRQGATAVILLTDATSEQQIGFVGHGFEEGTYGLEGSAQAHPTSTVPVVLVRQSIAAPLRTGKASIKADLRYDSFIYPSINVVAKAPGADASLKNEYVLFSGHHDHDGVADQVQGDSIWNGADDNGTVSVAMLAIGRAWKQNPGQRSALFVWHGAEERGLLGSRWYAEHPTVKKESIVAVLNGDMIGRNAPDSAALLGSTLPHRNSQALVDMALQANQNFSKFSIDTSWDDVRHPEGWYFRSDHLPYARAGIPAIFFTTLLHPDYHTAKDEADRIDYRKLTRMTHWMYATGWAISNTPQRPTVDPNFKLER
ncbi:M28 family metallopeptidase [Sabulibacter ruber]|uniref:M28 family metallopeptidase n=1 Tax=Sabulibacter ruber TaxID=2811901 RepID=UPI001A95E2DF|nr:M28 family peptidase [Sabulibacter ruber]